MAEKSKAKEAGEFEPQGDWGRFLDLEVEAQNGEANEVTKLAVQLCVFVHKIIECMARRDDKVKRTVFDVLYYLFKIAPEVFDKDNIKKIFNVYTSLKNWGEPDDPDLDPSLQMSIYVGSAVNCMYKLVLKSSIKKGDLIIGKNQKTKKNTKKKKGAKK